LNSTKAVFYDPDGTLVLGRPDIWQLYAQFAAEYGLVVSSDGIRKAERFAHFYYAGLNYKADLDQYGAAGFRQNYLRRCLETMQCEGDLDSVARFLVSRLDETPRERYLPDGTLDTLAQVAERGYTLGLITNRRTDELAGVYEGHLLAACRRGII
jgi:phosphoglycolate phosphatase-like HAD superfamily hydrolase